ncbi:type IV secretion system DNA-binding domain-containing protein [Escherichia coli]
MTVRWEFVKSYYDPSIDKILNPLDARCAAWDLWPFA